MGYLQTTQAELEAFWAKATPGFLEYVRSHSTDVGAIEVATTKEGIRSMPAIQTLGGVEKTVAVPLDLMTADADAAAADAGKAAEEARQAAETTLQTNDTVKREEEQRQDDEQARKLAEQGRVRAEAARVQSEQDRDNNERGRLDAEDARVDAEAARVQAETAREAAFNASKAAADAATQAARQTESDLKAAEALRVKAEQGRVSAEQARESAFSKAKTDAEAATKNANDAADRVDAAVLDISTQKQAALDAADYAKTQGDNAKSIYNTVTSWFNGTSGFKATVEKWFQDTKTAWNTWFNGTKSDWTAWFAARKSEWTTWYNGIKSTYDSWFATATAAEAERVTAETTRQSQEAGRVTAENKRVAEMDELNSHPVRVGDNGNWWRWNLQKHEYEDTGVLAKGGILYPTFEIDLDDMGLYMCGSSEVSRESFEFDDADGGMYFLPRKSETS